MKNQRVKERARSAKRRCKPGVWNSKEAADRALYRIAEQEPLKALGMRSYWCNQCGKHHIGRGSES